MTKKTIRNTMKMKKNQKNKDLNQMKNQIQIMPEIKFKMINLQLRKRFSNNN